MKNKVSKYGLFVGFLLAQLVFGLFVTPVQADYYSPYYNYNNNSTYQYYPNNINLNYSNYKQSCPVGFSLGIQNNIYVCYKLLNESYNSSYYNHVNTTSGCMPGYIYSPTTGQRCDGYSNYYDYYSYDENGEIRNFDVRDGSDTNLEEGNRNQEIMKVRFDVYDGDIRLDKIEFDFEFRGNNYGEDLPWNIFNEISLLSDGKVIKRIDSDSRSDWDKNSNDSYSFTFTNLNELIRNGNRANLTLEVDIDSDINGINNGDITWDIFIPDKGLKARNNNGSTIYMGDNKEIVSIDINY